ncbi:MAG: glycoside hydrolase family 5 protein [Eubacterium sp.]|nr:glycoside hydrolase family 5 protein [Eubacterium sp.]
MKRRLISLLLAIMMIIVGVLIVPDKINVEAAEDNSTPFAKHGELHVDGIYLKDSHNEKFQLRGASLHGLQWDVGYNYISRDSFKTLRDSFGVNAVRLPVYVTQGGYTEGAASRMDGYIENAVSIARDLGMYVVIDWHVHDAYGGTANPNTWKSSAISFFEKYASKYKSYGNVLYEICNEPVNTEWYNGSGNDLYSYANAVVPIIRKYTNAIVIVGTNTWSQEPDEVAAHKLSYSNTMYTVHFYSATHIGGDGNWVYDNVKSALKSGVPVFCSEFGICDASGNGNYNVDSANKWMQLFDEYSISFFCWHLSNKGESSAYLKTSCSKLSGWTDSDLSTTGSWFKNVCLTRAAKEKPSEPVTVYNGVDYSRVFNYNYYVNHNADVKKAFGNDYLAVLKHFVTYGMREGRRAKASFDVKSYKNANADLRVAYGNDLTKYYLHYIKWGYKENRKATGVSKLQNPITKLDGVDYSRVYDFNYYLSKNPDVKKAFGNDDVAVLRHFINYGMKEGRRAKASFDVNSYKLGYRDLRTAFGNDNKSYYLHYINYGYKENRKTTGITQLRQGTTIYNGVDYSKVYNYTYYVNKYPDVKKAFGNNEQAVIWHFVNYGMKEGRQGIKTFNLKVYKSKNADLRKAYGSDNKSYYMHYLKWGYKEKRKSY